MELNTLSMIGFPAFMCLWFMFRMEKVIKSNTEALYKLKNSIDLEMLKK